MAEATAFRELDSAPLWPTGTPGAVGSGPEDTPRITPFLPPCPTPTAAIIVCPGGGYCHLGAKEGAPAAQWLCSLGIAGLVLDYRVGPRYRHPAPLLDAQQAVRLVRHRAGQWNVDHRRVGIMGFSAGGHLAVSAATIFEPPQPDSRNPIRRWSSRPDVFIACYPVITFGPYRHEGTMLNLLGDGSDPKLQQELSLENRVTPQTPPGFIWHTLEDPTVRVENSLLLAGSLRRANVPFELHVFQSGVERHGLAMATDVPGVNWTEPCAAWLAKVGFMPPS